MAIFTRKVPASHPAAIYRKSPQGSPQRFTNKKKPSAASLFFYRMSPQTTPQTNLQISYGFHHRLVNIIILFVLPFATPFPYQARNRNMFARQTKRFCVCMMICFPFRHIARCQAREDLLADIRGPAFAEKVEKPRRRRESDEPRLVP